MFAVINRHKAVFIILAIIVLAVVVWLLLSAQSNSRIPSKGVFVSDITRSILSEGVSI